MGGHDFITDEKQKVVESGLTQEFIQMNTCNYKMIHNELEWEDIASIKQTSELLERLQDIPMYWYKMNYLMHIYREKLQEYAGRELVRKWEEESDFRKSFFAYIEKIEKRELKRKDYKDSDYEALIDMVFKCMKTDQDSFYPDYASDPEIEEKYYKLIFDKFQRQSKKMDNLFEFALVVNMPVDTFEEFLRKGMRRGGFNFYNPQEVIMYCVLKYGEAGIKKKSYDALMEYYSKLASDSSGNHYKYSLEIRGKIDAKFRDMDSFRLFADTSLEQVSSEMKEILQTLKNSEPKERTIIEVYKELKEKAIFRNGRDILSYALQTDKDDDIARGKLKIEYDGTEITIPKGTEFYFIDKDSDDEYIVKDYERRFVTIQKVVLPKTGHTSVKEVEVESLTPECTVDKRGEKIVAPTNTVFSQRAGYELPGILSITNGKNTIKRISEEIKLGDIKPDDSKLFRFLYSEASDSRDDKSVEKSLFLWNPANEIQVKKELLGNWFLETKFGQASARTRNEEAGREIYISRSDILTMAFLAFLGNMPLDDNKYRAELKGKDAYKHEDTIAYFTMQYKKKNNGERPGSRDIYDYFTDRVNKVLEECGMQLFDLSNSYDCLLAYLLLSDEPITVLRQLWRIALE